MARTGGLLLALAACCAVVAACGGNGVTTNKAVTVTVPAPTAAEPPPTKAQFVSEVNAICADDRARLRHVQARLGPTAGLSAETKAVPPLVREAVAIERSDLAKIRGLPEPPGEARVINQLLIANEEKDTDESNYGRAIERDDPSAAEAAAEAAKTAKTRAVGLGEGYGIKCGPEGE